MQKIGFCDRYGLTQAVLNGTKTMTRRVIPSKVVEYALTTYRQEYYSAALDYLDDYECLVGYLIVEKNTRYKLGEVVAVAQPYKDIANTHHFIETCLANEWSFDYRDAGWNNSLFVKPCLMPHQIRITDIRIERLQDITDEDCLKEGVYYDVDVDGYKVHNLTLPNKGFKGDCFRQKYFKIPREAFAALIEKLGVGRKGLWAENPLVVAYGFELVK